jgi:hypothetical protein
MENTVERRALIRRAPDIVASEIDGEYLIMSIERGSYIALRDASARIWEILEQPHTFGSLIDALLGEYAVAPDICKRDVDEFLKEMIETNLITLEHAE